MSNPETEPDVTEAPDEVEVPDEEGHAEPPEDDEDGPEADESAQDAPNWGGGQYGANKP